MMVAARIRIHRSASILLQHATSHRWRLHLLPLSSCNEGILDRCPPFNTSAGAALLHRRKSDRFFQWTPSILSDEKYGSNHGSDGTRPKSIKRARLSHTNTNISSTNNNYYDEQHDYTTDTHDFTDEQQDTDELKLWHEAKEAEFQQMDIKTSEILSSSSSKNGGRDNIQHIVFQLQQWNEFISSITTEMNFDFRIQNPQYPPSEFMSSVTYDAAEKAQSLLMHLITNHSKIIHPGVEVSAYKQVMNAWSNVFHWSAGDRCEEILEVYGQKFGGDMNYMPSIDDYKTVMKAHLKSCSSLSRYYEDSAALSAAATTSIPGGKALEILNLLNNVFTAGDLFLKPDVELYSHTIAVVRNTLLDWRMRRRFRDGGAADDDNNDVDANDVDATSVEKQLCLELLSGLEQMEVAMAEEATIQGHHSKVSSSLDKWFCIIRAYADAIAVLSRVPLRDEDYESIRSCEQMLESLEQFILSNADAILQCAGQDESNNKLLDEIKFSVEGAYLSNLSSQWLVSDFGTAIKNASRSEEILNRMKERSRYAVPEESFLFPAPTPKHVQALIRAHVECLRSRYFSPESNSLLEKFEELPHLKAQRLLKDLESQHAGRPIDGSLYSDIAWAWSQVPHWSSIYKRDKYTSAPHSAKALLKHTMNQYSKGSIYFSDIGTITKMYNYIFAALYSQMARNSRNFKGKEASLKQCLELFGDMECCYKESDGVIAKPNSHTLGLILKIICNSGVSSSVECAQTIFQRLTSCGVNARQGDYLVLMKICSSDPTKVEEILYGVKSNHHKDQSAKATTALYTECISAYAKSRHQNSASKVMELFDELNQLYESTGDPDFRPDSILYGATLDAISKAKSKGDASLRLALRLLDKMERKFDAGEIVEAPNRYAYTSILSSISQAKLLDGHVLAEDLLRKMKDRSRQINNPSIRLDAVAYTALLQTLARSKCPDKIERAKKWFAEMETLYAEGNSDLKPNKITYTALINCWRTSGRPDAGEQAQKILDLVEQRYKEGDYTIKPDATLYSSVIDAWSRDKSEVKVTRAYELYSRMKEHYSKGDVDMKPNDITMATVIKCCGFSQGGELAKKKALQVLLQCFSDVTSNKDIGRSPSTYYSLLTSLSRLVKDDARRRPISASIFEACVTAGQINGSVLSALSECQPELYVKLPFVTNGKYRMEDIPSNWRRNVVQG